MFDSTNKSKTNFKYKNKILHLPGVGNARCIAELVVVVVVVVGVTVVVDAIVVIGGPRGGEVEGCTTMKRVNIQQTITTRKMTNQHYGERRDIIALIGATSTALDRNRIEIQHREWNIYNARQRRKKYIEADEFEYSINEKEAIYCPNVPVFRSNMKNG